MLTSSPSTTWKVLNRWVLKHKVLQDCGTAICALLIYHWTSLAKNLNGAKRFDDYTVVIVSGNTKQRRCSFKYTSGRWNGGKSMGVTAMFMSVLLADWVGLRLLLSCMHWRLDKLQAFHPCSRLYCGPVRSSVFIDDCRDCVFSLACQQVC